MTEQTLEIGKEQLENWERLLEEAVNNPGFLTTAFRQFYGYSIGNQMLALWQCHVRGIEPGPLATYKRWQELGRQVRGNEQGIYLWQPVTKKGTRVVTERDPITGKEEEVEKKFTYRKFYLWKKWFVLSQTTGEEYELPETGEWSLTRALEILDIDQVPFTSTDGTCLGSARMDDGQKQITINPFADDHIRVAIHEIAHHEIGHTAENIELIDNDKTPRNLREVEAEAVALIVCESLELEGSVHSRGYIQHWWGEGNKVPEASAQKIFSVANNILLTGRGEEANGNGKNSN